MLPGNEAGVQRSQGLALRDFTKVFGQTRALTAVNLDIEYGQILGLLGHNGSGKSTLFKILAGLYEPDAGQLSLHGEDVPLPLTSTAAARIGLTFVHQNLVMLPELSVTENLFLESTATSERKRPISWRRMRAAAQQILDQFDLDIDINVSVAKLGPGHRAQLAIARAAHQARLHSTSGGAFLMLDEPTVFLSQNERTNLFKLLRGMASSGVGIVLVSHDLADIETATDRVCVLRDGRVAAVRRTAETDRRELIADILGNERVVSPVGRSAISARRDGERPLVEVRGMTGVGVRQVDLDLFRGEVVGLTGLVGAGYSRILDMMYGSRRAAAGEIAVDGVSHDLRSARPTKSLAQSIVLVPGDRLGQGLIGSQTAAENLAVPIVERFRRKGHVRAKPIAENFETAAKTFAIRPPVATQPAGEFSGGNQQKILMAKWLQTDPKVVLVDEPTQGVDVGARQEILRRLRELAETGQACVVVASSDYEQLAQICDRVLVVLRGRIAGELVGDEITAARISTACLRGFQPHRSSEEALDGAGKTDSGHRKLERNVG